MYKSLSIYAYMHKEEYNQHSYTHIHPYTHIHIYVRIYTRTHMYTYTQLHASTDAYYTHTHTQEYILAPKQIYEEWKQIDSRKKGNRLWS